MASEKFLETVDEFVRVESRLKEENFSTYTLEAVECERNEVESLWLKYKEIYEECLESATEKKKLYAKHREAHKTYIRCVNLIAKAKKTISDENNAIEEVSKKDFAVHVPHCDIGVFKGDYVSWPTFRDMFTAIYVNNTRLSKVEKLFYLFQKTEGEARDINRNLNLTSDNFDIAWSNLKTQYENKRVLINSQLRLLFNMAPCQQDSAQEVKRLQREINNCLAILNLFEVDIASWDPIFVFLCSSRLCERTLSLWEQSVINKTEIPKWLELNSFLTNRFHTLESVSDVMTTSNQWPSGSQATLRKNHQAGDTIKQSKALQTKVNEVNCHLCSESHSIASCKKFLSMDNRNRVYNLRKFRYCFNCLTTGHMYADCGSPNGCSKCSRKHHTLLHRDGPKKSNNSKPVAQGQQQVHLSGGDNIQSTRSNVNPGPSGAVQSHHTTVAKKVMLATAWVNIYHCGSTYKVRALIDPCSDDSFVSERIQRLLRLPTVPVQAEISGLGGDIISTSTKRATFTICSLKDRKAALRVEALVVAQVTGNVPTHSIYPKENISLPQLDYADPNFYESNRVDILLGGDLYPKILLNGIERGICETLVAQETIFGYIVTGPTTGKSERDAIRVTHATRVSIRDQLAQFWELEEIPKEKLLSEDERKCEEIFCATTERNSDGRYIVNLPFKENIASLGENRNLAVRQYVRNESSLSKKPTYKTMYEEVIKEYIDMGHMERIEGSKGGPRYYLPHHGVYKPESTTTKLRVVFNASSKTSTGKSLNDILYIGPALQQDLVALLVKWRSFPFVFNADISKMYRQILINPEHTRYQSIVYRGQSNDEINDYELKTVTFGINCAPYLAIRTLLRLADDEEHRFPIGAKIIRESIYVDDLLVGAYTISGALEARKQVTKILATAGFELRKWTSNRSEILENLDVGHLLSSSFVALDSKSTAKTLGIHWNAASDHFYFVTKEIKLQSEYTMRTVLSLIAGLYDPLGWLSPILITGKIIMQNLWLDKIGWDDGLKPIAHHKWTKFLSTFNDINLITIPRFIGYSPEFELEYHGFCDASELAYAAAIYCRVKIEGHILCNLILSKTKVAPIKKISLPRLELCGAHLLAKLVSKYVPVPESSSPTVKLWSDSTIVLAWLRKPACTWKTFVANRVNLITEKVGKSDWAHVTSEFNPADLATRGRTPLELKESSLWWHGPEWLRHEKSSWPTTDKEFTTTEESRPAQVFVARSPEEEVLDRFSTWPKAIHVLAYVFRFFFRTHNRDKAHLYKNVRVSAEELAFVKSRLFSLSQQRSFPREFCCLSKGQNLPKDSPLLTLTPFIDKNAIIRANGRLGSTNCLSYNERHPIVLAYDSRLSKLYVDFVHKLVLHGGPRLTLHTVRQECWILKAKNLVRTHIRNCKECVLYRKKFQGQVMAALPQERTTFSRPFSRTGVDFAGPFEIKSFTGRYCRITKGYACLFVCFATKAIHLEAVSELSTPAFLAALARFVARRGCPHDIYSDNGRNFVGAARRLDSDFVAHVKQLRDEAVDKYGHQNLSWHFIPASAPHMGGLWEAGVKSMKMHLKKVSGQIKYTFEEFATLLATIESCLNSRPLSALSNDVEDFDALTPGHFLIGSTLLTPAEPEEPGPADSILNRWRKVKAMQHELCRRWKEEYLKELNKRTKWKTPHLDIEIDDLVVIRGEPVCPNEWRLGRVTKVFRGSDGHVRVAELKTQNGLITRPIHKMVLLPRAT